MAPARRRMHAHFECLRRQREERNFQQFSRPGLSRARRALPGRLVHRLVAVEGPDLS